jgi:hypothetical protein
VATRLSLDILAQPDDVTCGPTCLHAVYRSFGDDVPIEQIIRELRPPTATSSQYPSRGTLAVLLAQHALERGYQATLWVYALDIFDPTWFRTGGDVRAKLRDQMGVKTNERLQFVSREYLRFLDMGGQLRYEELNPDMLRRLLEPGAPVLAGLSATYLYGCAREVDDGARVYYDDVRGSSTGHFVVLYGYHPDTREVLVADPLRENPRFGDQHYSVGVHRLVGAIMLGVLTYDGNLLVLEPPAGRRISGDAGPGLAPGSEGGAETT